MIFEILNYFKWYYSFVKKIIHTIPAYTISTVVLVNFNQILGLVSFFLPIKILIIANSGNIPSFLFEVLPEKTSITSIVIILGTVTILAFILNLILDNRLERIIEKGSGILFEKTKKLTTYKGQSAIALNALDKGVKTLASLMFVFLVIITLSCFYTELAVLMIATMFILFTVFWLGYNKLNSRFSFKKDPRKVIVILIGVWLLGVVAFLILDVVIAESNVSHFSIIGFILAKQLQPRIKSIIFDSIWLNENRSKVSDIFFYYSSCQVVIPAKEKFLSLAYNQNWLSEFVRNVNEKTVLNSAEACYLGKKNLISFLCKIDIKGENKTWVVKLYLNENCNQSREVEFFSIFRPRTSLIYVGKHENFTVHVIELSNKTEPYVLNENELRTFTLKLMDLNLDKELINTYSRSHVNIIKRIELINFIDVSKLVPKQYCQDLIEFEKKKNEIARMLNSLPYKLANNNLRPGVLVVKDSPYLLDWSDWAIEPKGFQNKSFSSEEYLSVIISMYRKIERDLLNDNYYSVAKKCREVIRMLGKYNEC